MPTDLTTEAVLDLYVTLRELHRDGKPDSELVAAADEWFTAQGLPSILEGAVA